MFELRCLTFDDGMKGSDIGCGIKRIIQEDIEDALLWRITLEVLDRIYTLVSIGKAGS